eukprot:841603-Pyramimonas_sp.AAC.1
MPVLCSFRCRSAPASATSSPVPSSTRPCARGEVPTAGADPLGFLPFFARTSQARRSRCFDPSLDCA